MSSNAVTRSPKRSRMRPSRVHRGSDRSHAQPGDGARFRARKQLQHGGGDDAQRAFGADEQAASGRSRCCPCAGRAGRSIRGHRAAPPPGPASARACCRSAAHARRRHWWTGCRRSRSCPRPPGSAETSARRSAAASCTCCSRHPASTVMVLLAVSTARTRLSRDRLTMTALARQVGRRTAAQAGIAALGHDGDAGIVRAGRPRPRPRRCVDGLSTQRAAP